MKKSETTLPSPRPKLPLLSSHPCTLQEWIKLAARQTERQASLARHPTRQRCLTPSLASQLLQDTAMPPAPGCCAPLGTWGWKGRVEAGTAVAGARPAGGPRGNSGSKAGPSPEAGQEVSAPAPIRTAPSPPRVPPGPVRRPVPAPLSRASLLLWRLRTSRVGRWRRPLQLPAPPVQLQTTPPPPDVGTRIGNVGRISASRSAHTPPSIGMVRSPSPQKMFSKKKETW